MFVRGILAVLTMLAIVFLLWGMVADPSGSDPVAAVASEDTSAVQQASAPLRQYAFPAYGFTIEAPEDWRVMTADEHTQLADQVGDTYVSEDTIIALIPDIPNGSQTAMIMIDTLLEPMDDATLSAMNTMSTILTGLDWVSPRSWMGTKWTRVTTKPFAHEVGGYAAATMEMRVKSDGEGVQDAKMRMTMVEFPREAVSIMGIMTSDAFRNSEVETILASFTVIPNN